MKKKYTLIDRIIAIVLLVAMLGTTVLSDVAVTTVYASDTKSEDTVSTQSEENQERAAAEADGSSMDSDSGKDTSKKDDAASGKDDSSSAKDDTASGEDDSSSAKDDAASGKDNSSSDTADSSSTDSKKDDADNSASKDTATKSETTESGSKTEENTNDSSTGDDKNSSGSSAVNEDVTNDAENSQTSEVVSSEDVVPEEMGSSMLDELAELDEEDFSWRYSNDVVEFPGAGTANDPYQVVGIYGLEKLAHNVRVKEEYSKDKTFKVFADPNAGTNVIDLTGNDSMDTPVTWQIGTAANGDSSYFYGTIIFSSVIIHTDHPLFGIIGGGASIVGYRANVDDYNRVGNSKYWGGLAEEIRYGNPSLNDASGQKDTTVNIQSAYVTMEDLEIHDNNILAAGGLVGAVYNDKKQLTKVNINA